MNWRILELEDEMAEMAEDETVDFSCEIDQQALQMLIAEISNLTDKDMQEKPLWFQIVSQYIKPQSNEHYLTAWRIFDEFRFFAWNTGDSAYNPHTETLNRFEEQTG